MRVWGSLEAHLCVEGLIKGESHAGAGQDGDQNEERCRAHRVLRWQRLTAAKAVPHAHREGARVTRKAGREARRPLNRMGTAGGAGLSLNQKGRTGTIAVSYKESLNAAWTGIMCAVALIRLHRLQALDLWVVVRPDQDVYSMYSMFTAIVHC